MNTQDISCAIFSSNVAVNVLSLPALLVSHHSTVVWTRRVLEPACSRSGRRPAAHANV